MKAFNSWVARKTEASPGGADTGTGFLRGRVLGNAPEHPKSWEAEAAAVDSDARFEAEPAAPPPQRNGLHDGRTRLLGFDSSDGTSRDVFAEAPDASAKETTCPVGWLLVVRGPGRGQCFTLFNGMMKIGRGDDQAVRLNFGDSAISRDNHAAILFDPSSGLFWLGHGGKANIVRVNEKPLISDQSLSDGDEITIGETTLQIKTFCGPHFNWDTDPDEEDALQHLSLG